MKGTGRGSRAAVLVVVSLLGAARLDARPADPAAPPAGSVLKYADLNLDGKVDILDLVIEQGYLVGNVTQGNPPFLASLQAADALSDGAYNVFDAVVMAAFIVGNVASLPQFPTCVTQVAPTSEPFGPAGGASTVGVTAPPSCAWTATSNDAWISVTSGAPATGSGSVGYTVTANSGGARSGSLTVAGRTVNISQSGSTVDLQMSVACDSGAPPSCTVSAVGALKVISGSLKNDGTAAVPAGQARVTLNLGTGTQPNETEIGAGFAAAGVGWTLESGALGDKIVTLVSTVPVGAGQTVAVDVTIATPGLGYVLQNSLTAVFAGDTNPGNNVAGFILARGQ